MNAPQALVKSRVEVELQPGAAAILDSVAESADPAHEFLRAAWFAGSGEGSPIETLVAWRSGGRPLAAIPTKRRRWLRDVPGSYWPFRSFPIDSSATDAEVTFMLRDARVRAALGRAWRLGPVYSDDPTATRVLGLARSAGWTVLTRSLGSCYILDLKRLRAEGPWPSPQTERTNRWRERRLADLGALEFMRFSGSVWSADVFDALAAIERESWVGRQGGDTKFLDPAMRRVWETALTDPELAQRLVCSILYVGGEPAAFTFTLRAGTTVHCIANSFRERFREQSPGRLLLYREFARAADEGTEKVDWGAGDAGYTLSAFDGGVAVAKRTLTKLAGPDIVRRFRR